MKKLHLPNTIDPSDIQHWLIQYLLMDKFRIIIINIFNMKTCNVTTPSFD